MLLRVLLKRHIVTLIVIYLFIFIVVVVVKFFGSSAHLKHPSCPLLNGTSGSKMLYQLLNNNTEDERTSVDDYSMWCLYMANHLDNEQRLSQSPILRAPSINSTRLQRLPYRYSLWESSPVLPRRITACEHSLIMRLLMIIERICRKHKITYMLSDGTLLGSLRHHDIVPWDDDIDIMIPVEDRIRFGNIIKQMNETLIQHTILSNENKTREYYKISFKNTPSAGGYSWNFPFIDIFFYLTNGTHLWQMDDPNTTMELKYVFPLVMRPFGELWLPAPREPRQVFSFDPFDQCERHYWDHKNETGQETLVFKCDDLKDIYPFVERNNQSNSTEILKINNTIIHTITYN